MTISESKDCNSYQPLKNNYIQVFYWIFQINTVENSLVYLHRHEMPTKF